jgi:hypothetical protein
MRWEHETKLSNAAAQRWRVLKQIGVNPGLSKIDSGTHTTDPAPYYKDAFSFLSSIAGEITTISRHLGYLHQQQPGWRARRQIGGLIEQFTSNMVDLVG